MRRLSDREYNDLMAKPDVGEAMKIRCEEAGHEWENCCSVVMQLYQECKWCGERRGFR